MPLSAPSVSSSPSLPVAAPDAADAQAPRDALLACFTRIAATRMAGLPICHADLHVSVPVLQDHQGDWLGVLVTPWAMSLVLLPGSSGRFRPLAVGDSQDWAFPSGTYTFFGNSEAGLGPYQTCSLYSPMFEFADQAGADTVARAALIALLHPADAANATGVTDAAAPSATAPAPVTPPAGQGAAVPARRAFLRGRFGAPPP